MVSYPEKTDWWRKIRQFFNQSSKVKQPAARGLVKRHTPRAWANCLGYSQCLSWGCLLCFRMLLAQCEQYSFDVLLFVFLLNLELKITLNSASMVLSKRKENSTWMVSLTAWLCFLFDPSLQVFFCLGYTSVTQDAVERLSPENWKPQVRAMLELRAIHHKSSEN